MTNERRRPEALGLRVLFQDQLSRLSQLFDAYQARKTSDRERSREEDAAVETVVDGTNAKLRFISSYRARLRDSTQRLLDHVDTLVARVPDPLTVSADNFFRDPYVNAFFVNKNAVADIFSRSQALRDFFADPGNASVDTACAVLFMNSKEKTVLGMEMMGEVARRDVKKTTVSFTNHEIAAPRRDSAEVRVALKRFLFESFVEYVKYRLTRLDVGAEGADQELAGSRLQEVIRTEGRDLGNPEHYLEVLRHILETPEELLRLDTRIIRINRVGDMVTHDAREIAHELTLHEVAVGHRSHELMTLVSYPRREMRSPDGIFREATAFLG